MLGTGRAARDGRLTAHAERARLRSRLASPTTAVVLAGLSLVSAVAMIPLQLLVPGVASPTGSADVSAVLVWFAFGLSFTAVGVVVARREPGNPMGWLLLGVALAIQVGSLAPAYGYLDYRVHHGRLPLGPLAVLLGQAWLYGFMLLPLIVLFFPDRRIGSRWRWPLRLYLATIAVFVAGTVNLAVVALRVRIPIDSQGNLAGSSDAHGGAGWFVAAQGPLTLLFGLFCVAAVAYQLLSFRTSSGERREQLKWLGAGSAGAVVVLLVTIFWPSAPAFVGSVVLPLALAGLPLSIGVGIVRYRLYEIDRLLSRTLSYAILTALLAGTFIGLIALTTNTLALSGRVGVAASTLAAAALVNPLRIRIQRTVDRRFNRARYDAEATVAAFTARLRDAVELETIRGDLLDAVNHAVQPAHASVWIRETPRG